MINNNFTEVKPLHYWVQHILPLVYDDSLSYMELLGRVTKKLNELIVNNNKLPDFIAEQIKDYISSGAIEKVLAEVLADYMLNVKFPPAGLTPATGDGSADDTEAIQGCIDYAFNHGGMAVYFPSGSYLTQPLTLRDKATLFGQDRYTTRLVMKGGSTKAMFTGNVDELTLTGLGFDGNMDIQVNNVNLFTISVNSAIITNCLLTDGYDLLNITVNNDLQLNNVIFKHAVENALVLNGNGFVQGDNLIFETISALVGKNFVVVNVSNSILEQLKCHGASPNDVLINGNNNVVKMWNDQSTKAYTDNGTNNTIVVYAQSEQKKLTGFKTTNVSGNLSETVGGDKTETITGDKTETITGNKTEAITGDKTETITGNKTEAITGDTTKGVNGSYSKHIGGTYTKAVNGNSSESYEGNYIKNVTGVASETYSNNKTVTGKKVVINATNYNVNASGEVSVSGDDIALKPTNPLTYRNVVDGTPFKYVEMKDTGGNPYKLLASTSDNFDILPILDVTKYGVLPDGSDISDRLNKIIRTYGDSYTIYMKKGTFTASKTIVINNYQCKLVCDGVIKSSAGVAINVLCNGVQLDITELSGTGVAGSCGLLVGGELIDAIGNGNFHLQSIVNFDYGIILRGNHGYGVQNNNFYLNRIDHFKVGITLECGDGASWVNENRFYDCWCFGYDGTGGNEIGVKFNKGSEQTDAFNGNRFVNFSCEGCATMFNLSFAQRNSFIDFRMIEQTGNKQIVCDNESPDNLFTSVNAWADIGMFNDQSVNNIYKIKAYKNKILVCDSFTFAFGVFMPLDNCLAFNNMNYVFNGNSGSIAEASPLKYLTLINGTSNKMTVVLPLSVNYPQTMGNGFYIETGEIKGEIELICYGGQVFISSNNETTTLTGYHLKPWSVYLVTCVGVMVWKLIEIHA